MKIGWLSKKNYTCVHLVTINGTEGAVFIIGGSGLKRDYLTRVKKMCT